MPFGVRLRVVVRGISPLIVRTIGVPGGVSLVELHCMLLACFGWSGEHLHVFGSAVVPTQTRATSTLNDRRM